MRQQYHFRPVDGDVLIWNVRRLVRLTRDLPREDVPLSEIRELDEECCYGTSRPTCRSVAEHLGLALDADLAFPVILCAEGRVMDGMHRIVRALAEGRDHVPAVRFPGTPDPDYRNVHPDDLPYDEELHEAEGQG